MLPSRASCRHIYPLLARAWALVFLAVGLWLAISPESLCGFINGTVTAVLGGEWTTVREPRLTLGHSLAVAYMAVITVLAWQCSVRPGTREPYLALLTAKVASTAGFLVLAAGTPRNLYPAWVLLALGDAFVATTLWLARRDWVVRRPEAGGPAGLARVYEGSGPCYEVMFGKVDLGPGRAFWFRHALIDGRTREASAWGILFDEDEAGRPRIRAQRETFPLGSAADGTSATGARGHAGDIAWDLEWKDRGRSFAHLSRGLQLLVGARNGAFSPCLDVRASGEIVVGGRRIPVENATGMLGHHFGRKHAITWVWAHCNRFEGEEDTVFEGFTGCGKVGPWKRTVSGFVLIAGGARYEFPATLFGKAASLWRDGRWAFEVSGEGATLSGTVHAPIPERIATVAYEDTDGSTIWCRNSKLAALELRLVCPSRGIDRTLRAADTAAFEWADREAPPAAAITLGREG